LYLFIYSTTILTNKIIKINLIKVDLYVLKKLLNILSYVSMRGGRGIFKGAPDLNFIFASGKSNSILVRGSAD